jgi:hypothetical protein
MKFLVVHRLLVVRRHRLGLIVVRRRWLVMRRH